MPLGFLPIINVMRAVVGLVLIGTLLDGCSRVTQSLPTAGENDALVHDNAISERVLHSFGAAGDGSSPSGGLIYYDGLLYGVTQYGGYMGSLQCNLGCGTVYSVNPSTGEEKVVYAFQGDSDGRGPQGGLEAYNGVLYGITYLGGGSGCGGNGCGTVFGVSSSGQEVFTYRFQGGTGGAGPWAFTIGDGTLYGATLNGGGSPNCSSIGGCGTIFSLTLEGIEKTIYRFSGRGAYDVGPGNVLAYSNGSLYGFTEAGPTTAAAIFSLSLTGQETLLYRFTGGVQGGNPLSLIRWKGAFYGTTLFGGGKGCNQYGGTLGCGFAFKVDRLGGFHTLHVFAGKKKDGSIPDGVAMHDKSLYGVVESGGVYACPALSQYAQCGAVWRINRDGKYSNLYSFQGGADGYAPDTAPVFVGPSTMYGVTAHGGQNCDCGTVYALTVAGP